MILQDDTVLASTYVLLLCAGHIENQCYLYNQGPFLLLSRICRISSGDINREEETRNTQSGFWTALARARIVTTTARWRNEVGS